MWKREVLISVGAGGEGRGDSREIPGPEMAGLFGKLVYTLSPQFGHGSGGRRWSRLGRGMLL